jgi:hypothetical protein
MKFCFNPRQASYHFFPLAWYIVLEHPQSVLTPYIHSVHHFTVCILSIFKARVSLRSLHHRCVVTPSKHANRADSCSDVSSDLYPGVLVSSQDWVIYYPDVFYGFSDPLIQITSDTWSRPRPLLYISFQIHHHHHHPNFLNCVQPKLQIIY